MFGSDDSISDNVPILFRCCFCLVPPLMDHCLLVLMCVGFQFRGQENLGAWSLVRMIRGFSDFGQGYQGSTKVTRTNRSTWYKEFQSKDKIENQRASAHRAFTAFLRGGNTSFFPLVFATSTRNCRRPHRSCEIEVMTNDPRFLSNEIKEKDFSIHNLIDFSFDLRL